MIRVTHGVNSNLFDVIGQTIAEVRANLGALYGIPKDAIALVPNDSVGEGHVLTVGEELDFIVENGQKGVGLRIWTDAMQFCHDFGIRAEDLDQWIAAGLRVLPCQDGSIRITETAVDEFVRGRKVESPYFTVEEAAQYLRTTVKGIYAFVERGRLRKCPGTRTLLFTREMLDACVQGD